MSSSKTFCTVKSTLESFSVSIFVCGKKLFLWKKSRHRKVSKILLVERKGKSWRLINFNFWLFKFRISREKSLVMSIELKCYIHSKNHGHHMNWSTSINQWGVIISKAPWKLHIATVWCRWKTKNNSINFHQKTINILLYFGYPLFLAFLYFQETQHFGFCAILFQFVHNLITLPRGF